MSYDNYFKYRNKKLRNIEHKPYLKIHDNNLISCSNVTMGRILWEYICWVLGGKPKNFEPTK